MAESDERLGDAQLMLNISHSFLSRCVRYSESLAVLTWTQRFGAIWRECGLGDPPSGLMAGSCLSLCLSAVMWKMWVFKQILHSLTSQAEVPSSVFMFYSIQWIPMGQVFTDCFITYDYLRRSSHWHEVSNSCQYMSKIMEENVLSAFNGTTC